MIMVSIGVFYIISSIADSFFLQELSENTCKHVTAIREIRK